MALQQPFKNPMPANEFFEWLELQDCRHELVDGEPVIMAGGSLRHSDIATSGIASFKSQLKGSPCRAIGSKVAIRIPVGNIRYPDFGADCGTRTDDSLRFAIEPTIVAEVLSPSTKYFDCNKKLREYKSVESMKYILLIDPDSPQVELHIRGDDSDWFSTVYQGLEAIIEMKDVGLVLALSDLYEGLQFQFRPTIITFESPKPPRP